MQAAVDDLGDQEPGRAVLCASDHSPSAGRPAERRCNASAPSEAWLATEDSGEPAGCYLPWLPVRENVAMARVILQVPPGAAFAQAVGAQAGIAEANRILDVDSSLPTRLDRLRAETQAKSTGCSLLSWLGATPEQYLEGLPG